MINNIFFPPLCIGCGSFGIYLCERCGRLMREITQDWCMDCGNRLNTGDLCFSCQNKNKSLPIVAFWYYEKTITKIIQTIKYKNNRGLVYDLCRFISPQILTKIIILQDKYPSSVLVPVPLHNERQKERGFNQSKLIADCLGALVNLEVCNNLVIRVKNTPPQAKCTTKTERIVNIKNAFKVNIEALQNKTIILVDDVITTGSTTKEIAIQINKVNKNTPIISLCLAREEMTKQNH